MSRERKAIELEAEFVENDLCPKCRDAYWPCECGPVQVSKPEPEVKPKSRFWRARVSGRS